MSNEYSKDAGAWSARQQAWGTAVADLSDWQDVALSVAATASAITPRNAIIGGALLALAMGSGLAFWLVRDTRSAINTAVEATRRMAGHDLSQPVETNRRDEIGGLLLALETMLLNPERANSLPLGAYEKRQFPNYCSRPLRT